MKINDFFNVCFNHGEDQDYVFVDFTKMEKITVAKLDLINKLYQNHEVRNIFGLNYDFSQIWELIQIDSDNVNISKNDEVIQKNIFKK